MKISFTYLSIYMFFLAITIYLMKKRKLDFRLGFFWAMISILLIFFIVNEDMTNVKNIVKIKHISLMVISATGIFLLLLLFYLSVALSKIQGNVTKLAQRIGILESSLDDYKK